MEKYALDCPEDILKLVITSWQGKRDKIAGLSRDVGELAKQGDPNAVQIFGRAAEELALIVKGIKSQGVFESPVNISYSGGVFKSMEYLRPGLEDALGEIPHHLCEPQLLPVGGGILLACEKSGGSVNKEMVENLKTAQNIV